MHATPWTAYSSVSCSIPLTSTGVKKRKKRWWRRGKAEQGGQDGQCGLREPWDAGWKRMGAEAGPVEKGRGREDDDRGAMKGCE